MMVKKIDHIGIVVKDLEKSLSRYQELLGLKLMETEELEVAGDMYRVAFLPSRDVNLELVFTTAKRGISAEFLRDHGEGIHHVAFEVEDLEETFNELRAKGAKFIWGKIVPGSRGSKIAYLEPEDMNGVYIELIQKP
jgi:methylmalonyl-CoA/ethylmalonyl-CoA epimerase